MGVLEVSPKGGGWELAFRHGLHGTPGAPPSGFAPNAGPKLVIGTYKTASAAKRAGIEWLEADPNPRHEAARQEALSKTKPTGKLTKKERELVALIRKAGRQGVMVVDQWWRVARRLEARGLASLELDLSASPGPVGRKQAPRPPSVHAGPRAPAAALRGAGPLEGPQPHENRKGERQGGGPNGRPLAPSPGDFRVIGSEP